MSFLLELARARPGVANAGPTDFEHSPNASHGIRTEVVIAALRSPTGASAELLRRARRGDITLAASVSLFMEYEAVCTRPAHLGAAGLDESQARVVLDALASIIDAGDGAFSVAAAIAGIEEPSHERPVHLPAASAAFPP